jgi:hypothetical protein
MYVHIVHNCCTHSVISKELLESAAYVERWSVTRLSRTLKPGEVILSLARPQLHSERWVAKETSSIRNSPVNNRKPAI